MIALSICGAAVCLLAAADPAEQAEQAPSGSGEPAADSETAASPLARLVYVPLPITGNVDSRVRQIVHTLSDNLPEGPPKPILVFEFAAAGGESGEGTKFGHAYELAKYLASEDVSRFRTVAYIPDSIRGHAVLVAMACEEIIMRRGAELGAPGGPEDRVDRVERDAYDRIARRRSTIPAAVALGMIDPRLEVLQVRLGGGVRYLLSSELAQLKEDVKLEKEPAITEIKTLIHAGETGRFTAGRLRDDFHAVSYIVEDRSELARVLRVAAVETDPSLGGRWRAIRVDLTGVVNARKVRQVRRGIEDRRRGGDVNFVCLWLDSSGGSPEDSVTLANYLADLDGAKVHTVAYVPRQARGDAALVAMACDAVVMGEDAVLGGEGDYAFKSAGGPARRRNGLQGAGGGDALQGVGDAGQVQVLEQTIREIAKKKGRHWSLWAAMIDRGLIVRRCTRQGTGRVAYLSDEERREQLDPNLWQRGDAVTIPEEPFHTDGRAAQKLGLARYVVADFAELKRTYNIERIEKVGPNWALELIEALSRDEVKWLLLFVGGFALISEAMSPGIGVPGFVAGVCFLLFFWSQFLHGTAAWLDVLLFLTGVVCLAVEVFVIPGFGIFGLGGGALIIVSVILASQTFILPQNGYQFRQLPGSLLTVIAAGAGVLAAMIVMRRFIEKAPVVSRVMLVPPTGERAEELSERESLTHWNYLVGKCGTTTTQLTPSGKARFGDRLVDVISDGEVIPPDVPVRVVEVRGNVVEVEMIERPGDGPGDDTDSIV